MYVCEHVGGGGGVVYMLFNVVVQQQTVERRNLTKHLVFYMQFRIHEGQR